MWLQCLHFLAGSLLAYIGTPLWLCCCSRITDTSSLEVGGPTQCCKKGHLFKKTFIFTLWITNHAKHIHWIGWTLFQRMFGGRNSMSRSTFVSHNDKAKQWNYFLLAIKWLQIRCTYIAILIYHNLVTFVIQWHFVIITVYNVDKSGNFVVFF